MDTGRQRLKNTLKNLLLFFLFISMLVLTLLSWLADLSMENIPGDSSLAGLYQRLTYGISGFEIRTGNAPAAQPTRIAVSSAESLIGAQYHRASVSAFYDALSGQMGAALARSDAFEDCSQEDFAEALHGDVLYFGYEGYLPVTLLSNWLGRSIDLGLETDLLLLTAEGRLFVHTEEGYLVAHTDGGLAPWTNGAEELPQMSCSFAAEHEGLAHMRPDTLLLAHELISAARLVAHEPELFDAQSGSDLTALLGAFGYDPHVLSYPENTDLTRVFVDQYSKLHVSTDGTVIFRASALEGGIEAYAPGETGRGKVLGLQADFAYALVRSVQASIADETQAMLFDVAEGEGGVRVMTFIQLVDGIPVETTDSQPFARLEFRGNQLATARFHLRVLVEAEEQIPVLPSIQAAAAAPAGGLQQALLYVQQEAGDLIPRRVYVT